MKIFSAEIKKLFFSNRGWIILIALIVSQIIFFGFSNTNYNYQTEIYKSEYIFYLDTFGGKINSEKEILLNAEQERLLNLEQEASQIFQKLYEGEYTPAQYDEKAAELQNLTGKKAAFQQVISRWLYANEDPEHRYVMYDNGWNFAFSENILNYPLIFCVIVTAVIVFCKEYETQMYCIILSSKNGRSKTVISKLVVCLAVTVIFGLLSSGICLLCAHIRFGITNAGYPLQSISFFSESQYNLTIGQGYICVWILKILSLCLISIITSFFAVLLKHSAPVFFTGVMLVIIPGLILDLRNLLKFIPYLGLAHSGLYFSGVEEVVESTGELQTVPVAVSELAGVCVFSIILCCALWLAVKIIWNKSLKDKSDTHKALHIRKS